MAASVQIRRWTGSGPTKTDITSINTRLQTDDTHTTAGTTNPVLIPISGTNYSYWVTESLYVSAITGGTVNNIKVFMDGSNGFGTGITMPMSASATSYTQATGTVGTTGTVLNNTNYPGVSTLTDAFTYTSASPLSVTGTTTTTGDVGNLLVYQLAIASTASQGTKTAETLTWRYDDTSS